MMDSHKWRDTIINAFLRGSTLISKFALLFFLARYYDASELGVYGLLFSVVSLGVYILGFEYYNFSGRNLSASITTDEKSAWVGRHFSVIVTGLILSPFILLLSWFYEPLRDFGLIIFLLLIIELFSNEIYRLLIFLEKQLYASCLLFLRNGLWIFGFIGVWFYRQKKDLAPIEVTYLYWFWIIGSMLSVVLGLILLSRFSKGLALIRVLSMKVFFKEIHHSFTFFLNAVSQRLFFTIDKYLIAIVGNLELVGVYTFFVGVCFSMNSFLDAGVYSLFYPRLLRLKHTKEKFMTEFKRFAKANIYVTVFLFLVYLAAFYPMMLFLENELYSQYFVVFFLILIAISILNLSSTYHYLLYINKQEKRILQSSLFSLLFFTFVAFPLGLLLKVYGVATALLVGFIVLFYLKRRYSLKYG